MPLSPPPTLRPALFALAAALAITGCDDPQLTADAGMLGDGDLQGDALLRDMGDDPDDPQQDMGPVEPANPLINSILPNRGPVEGGLAVRLVGRDFVEGTTVTFVDRTDLVGIDRPCEGVTVENENRLTCTAPAGERAGLADVRVDWPDGSTAIIPEGFTWFEPVVLEFIEPPFGPALGGSPVILRGAGFVEGTEVRIGGIRADIAELREDGRFIEIVLPPGPPGVADVQVRNLNGVATVREGFIWYEELFVDDIDPPWGTADGDTEVRLAGIGLLGSSTVTFGNGQAQVLASELDRQRLRVLTPPAGLPGPVDVTVRNSNGVWQRERGFLYVRSGPGPFTVDGVVPDRLPASGGRDLFVGGNGFDDDTRVLLADGDGEQPIACALERPQLLRCTPPARAPGVVDVIVQTAEDREVLPDAVNFYRAIEIFDLAPDRGNMAGGTLVELVGTGLARDMEVDFDGNAAEVVEVDAAGENAVVRTPSGRRGLVSVRARTVDDETLLPQAFEYYDPTLGVGGIQGDPIANAVNVSVLDARFRFPVGGARVVVTGMGPRDRWEGVTDDFGRVTISDPALALPVTVTAAAADYSTTTYDRVTAEDVTLLLTSLVPPEQGPQDPRPEIPPVELLGNVFGIDLLEKPNTEGLMLLAFVETSHTSPNNRLGSPPPTPLGMLVEDGPFHLITRPGELAVVVTAGYIPIDLKLAYDNGEVGYWTLRDALIPIAMGLRRFITAAPGDIVEDLEVVMDRPLRSTVSARIDNPPGSVRGAPDRFSARPVLHLGAEGWFDFRYEQSGDTPRFRFDAMPDLEAWPDFDVTLFWDAEATQTDPSLPYAYSVAETETRETRNGVLIGPMVSTTAFVSPIDGGQLDAFRWVEFEVHPGYDRPEAPAEPADFHLVRVTRDGALVWTHILPGAVNRFQFPRLPEPLPGEDYADVDIGEFQISILSAIVAGAFEFEDFSYNDLGRIVSYSWSYISFIQ